MGISLYDIVRNPSWVKYDSEECEHNAATIIKNVDEEHQAVLLSIHGGLSIPDLVKAIGDISKIEDLDVTSLTVGMGALDTLTEMADDGKLDHVTFFLSSVMTSNNTNKKYGYDVKFNETLIEYKWKHIEINNHSKICLCKCANGNKYVIESSANFNKNPKMEQFRIICDSRNYDFYKSCLESIGTPETPANVKTLDFFMDDFRMELGL